LIQPSLAAVAFSAAAVFDLCMKRIAFDEQNVFLLGLMDRLQEIFQLQAELNQRIGVNTDQMQGNEKLQAEWVLNYIRAIQQEVGEVPAI
jgi:hypothetical protein